MEFNYENKQYLKMLEDLNPYFYNKYITFIKKFIKNKNNRFMDIGCGNGNVLAPLVADGYKNVYGCDISKLFINSAKKRGLKNVFWYDGGKIPFEDNYFDLVGSFCVLEHVKKPIFFLKEHIRLVKKGGYIIVTCPNLLTVFFKLGHPRVDTLNKRLKNIPKIFRKIFSNKVSFEKIDPIINNNFYPDADVVTIANLIDIVRLFKRYNCRIVCSNGFMINNGIIYKIIGSIPILKYFLPSCFVVFKKN